MADNPTNFWQELKRRRVIRAIIGYLASAYVLLELASIVIEPLGLPEWTIKLILVLLVVGFVIAISLAWIYDFTSRGIVKTESAMVAEEKAPEEKPTKRKLKVSDVIIAVLVVAVVILAYPKVFNKNKSLFDQAFENKNSIAVLPFMNNTGDPSYDSWEYGISNLMITSLSKSNELAVIDNQTIYEVIDNSGDVRLMSIGPDMAKEVARRIDVASYIYGDYFLAGSTFRINLKLIDTKNNKVLYTDYNEGLADSIITMVGSLSNEIKDFLEINIIREGTYTDPSGYITTKSPEAYRYFIQGMEQFWNGTPPTAKLNEAILIDSSFSEAYFYLSIITSINANYPMAKIALLKAEEGIDRLSPTMQIWIEAFKSVYFDKNPQRSVNLSKQAAEIDPYSRWNWYWLGWSYFQLNDWEGALTSLEKIITINKQLGPWKFQYFYSLYGESFMATGRFRKAKKIFKEGLRFAPESIELKEGQVKCALLQNDTYAANRYIEELKNALVNTAFLREPQIIAFEGNMYNGAGLYSKAEEKYKLALNKRLNQDIPEIDTANPGNSLFWYYHTLGSAQIKGEIDIEKGIENEIKALELSQKTDIPNHPFILLNLGLGYFKLGEYKKAIEFFKEAEKGSSIYNHFLAQKIQETQKALANQNK